MPSFIVVRGADIPTVSTGLTLDAIASIWSIISTSLAVWTIRVKATHDSIAPVIEMAKLTVGGRGDVHLQSSTFVK